jgi:hypothetical protein
MAGEIQISFTASQTCYFLVRNAVAQIWSSSGAGAFGTYNTPEYADYVNQMTEQGTASAYYQGNFPSTIDPGVYSITAKRQPGGSPLETDPTIATGDFQWNGTVSLPLSNLATSGQLSQVGPVKLTRGVMLENFLFTLVSSADHITPLTSGVVSGQILRDNGSFTALQSGAFTEKGMGVYRLQALTSGDLLCNTAALVFSAVGVSGGASDNRVFSLVLQRSSGQV